MSTGAKILNEERNICDLLVNESKKVEFVRGSFLGALLKERFNSLDMRSQYGGLKQFIYQYCEGQIIWVRKTGADDVYVHISNVNKGNLPSRDSSSLPLRSGESFWKAFSNPENGRELIIDKHSLQLSVKDVDAPMPEGFSNLEKLSREDHRKIAKDFLSSIESSIESHLKLQFEASLKEDDFWPNWTKLVNEHKDDGLYSRWLKWRQEQILKLFQDRVFAIGLSEDKVFQVHRVFKDSGVRTAPSKSTISTVPPSHFTQSRQGLHDIVHIAIDNMTEDELKKSLAAVRGFG